MNPNGKVKLNNVKNRFLPISEAVSRGLEPEPKITDFQIIKDLGVGSFGKVFLVTHKATGMQYAIKAIDKRNKANIEEKPYFRREIEIMYKINHPNVVRLYSNFEDDSNCYFIMEYIDKGNLYNLIPKDKKKKLSQQLVASIMKDVISAVYFLHNMNPATIHRDIKPENVLLAEGNVAKLTDFGWSNYIEDKTKRTTYCGTPIYLAPEIINETGHDEHVDIWCIGVLLFELITACVPFPGNDIETLQNNILNLQIAWPKDINIDARNLISKILKIDPKKRISLEEMLNHSFFTKNVPNPTQYLIKPDKLPSTIFIVSKDNPNNPPEIIPDEPKTQPIVILPQPQKKKAYERDISPTPKSKLKLDGLDQGMKLINIKNIAIPSPQGKIDENMKNICDQMKKDYDKLLVKYTNIVDSVTKKEKEIKTCSQKLRSLENGEEEQSLISKDEVYEERMKVLNETIKDIQDDNDSMKAKISEYERKLNKKGTGNDDRVNAIRDSLKPFPNEEHSEQVKKTANTFIAEVEKLKTELQLEKEKFTKILQEKNLEIRKMKEQQKDIKEKQARKFEKLIKKYETTLTMTERDNKILKLKIKELETKISKLNLTK